MSVAVESRNQRLFFWQGPEGVLDGVVHVADHRQQFQ